MASAPEVLDAITALAHVLARTDQFPDMESQNIIMFSLENDLLQATLFPDTNTIFFEPLLIITDEGREILEMVRRGENPGFEMDPKFKFAAFFINDVLNPLLEQGNALQ